MTQAHTIRRKAADAARLQADDALREILSEIEEEAQAAFLASRGNPEALTAAFRKVEAVETVRTALQARIDAQRVLDHNEARRGPHD